MQGDDGSASKKDLRKSPEITQKKKSTLQLTVDDFTLKYRLGKGAYGDVFFAVKNSDQQGYAMKQIQKKKLEKEGKEYQALVEK